MEDLTENNTVDESQAGENVNPPAEIGTMPAGIDTPDGGEGNPDESNESPESFPAAYVKKLRKENADYRTRAGRADELEEKNAAMATRLHAALVARDGRLANPEDLPFNPDHLEDEAALTAAITDLIKSRPGLKARSAGGDIGHGNRGTANHKPLSLIDMIRGAE